MTKHGHLSVEERAAVQTFAAKGAPSRQPPRRISATGIRPSWLDTSRGLKSAPCCLAPAAGLGTPAGTTFTWPTALDAIYTVTMTAVATPAALYQTSAGFTVVGTNTTARVQVYRCAHDRVPRQTGKPCPTGITTLARQMTYSWFFWCNRTCSSERRHGNRLEPTGSACSKGSVPGPYIEPVTAVAIPA
jgi:hypothetical protein